MSFRKLFSVSRTFAPLLWHQWLTQSLLILHKSLNWPLPITFHRSYSDNSLLVPYWDRNNKRHPAASFNESHLQILVYKPRSKYTHLWDQGPLRQTLKRSNYVFCLSFRFATYFMNRIEFCITRNLLKRRGAYWWSEGFWGNETNKMKRRFWLCQL